MANFLKHFAVAVLALGFTAIASAEVRLQGAGATFPDPIYQRWVVEYQKSNPDVKIDYKGIGSGGGIKGIIDKTLDFAGSDAPVSKSESAKAGAAVLQIPTVAGAVVPAYNLPGLTGELKLTGSLLADIYMGKITNWNDPKITAINPGLTLPDAAITPVYRTDGSGTNFIFTNYLATQSPAFKDQVGTGKTVQWPLGQGGKGNQGVTAVVQTTPGALGYIELAYAVQNKILFASVQNKEGNFIKASPQTVTAAGEAAAKSMTTDNLAVNLWNQSGQNAYPISAFTYIIVYKDLGYLNSSAKAKALIAFLNWATTQGQKFAPELDYAALSPAVQAKVGQAIGTLILGGK